MTGMSSMDPANRDERDVRPPPLTVIKGLTYTTDSQVLTRWLLPTYRVSFGRTGNRWDAEDVTTLVFKEVAAQTRLPEAVEVVDDRVAEAALEATSRHWSDRFGVARPRCFEAFGRDAARPEGAFLTLADLCDGLSPEMRLLVVLRFLRRRPLAAIALQLGVPPDSAAARLFAALSAVARRIGLDLPPGPDQADEVAAFAADLIEKQRPLRFEAMPAAWGALLASTHIQAAIAGNNLPDLRFVRSLETAYRTRRVTQVRIWSA
jgi:DNA-directed RNA polymerase specialized sigma24 family protein